MMEIIVQQSPFIVIDIWPFGRSPWSARLSVAKCLSFDNPPETEPATITGNVSLGGKMDRGDLAIWIKALQLADELAVQLDDLVTSREDFKAAYSVEPDFERGALLVKQEAKAK